MFKALLSIGYLWLMLVSVPAHAQVYKWVDEKGVTHYGERAPQGRKTQEVRDRLANPAGSGSAGAAQPSWQDQEAEFRGRRIESEQAEAKKQAQDTKQRKACIQARDELAQLKAARRVYKLDDKGERIFESDDERAASIARQEQLIAARC